MWIGVIVVKKINILFKFLNVNKPAVDDRTLSAQPCERPTNLTAAADTVDRSDSSSHIPIHFADKAPDGARSAISIQRDGARSAIGMSMCRR